MQEERKDKAQHEGWTAEELAEESNRNNPDEIKRRILRGDESEGDADERDIVGSSETIDTWQGREEAKTRAEGGTS
jgi:hypothetical protein